MREKRIVARGESEYLEEPIEYFFWSKKAAQGFAARLNMAGGIFGYWTVHDLDEEERLKGLVDG